MTTRSDAGTLNDVWWTWLIFLYSSFAHGSLVTPHSRAGEWILEDGLRYCPWETVLGRKGTPNQTLRLFYPSCGWTRSGTEIGVWYFVLGSQPLPGWPRAPATNTYLHSNFSSSSLSLVGGALMIVGGEQSVLASASFGGMGTTAVRIAAFGRITFNPFKTFPVLEMLEKGSC